MTTKTKEAQAAPATGAPEAYCVKCRSKQSIKDAAEITMKNGRPALKGVCPACGTGLFKIGGGK